MSNISTTNSVISLDQGSITKEQFEKLELKELGLEPENLNEVLQATQQLRDISPSSIAEFGKAVKGNAANYSDDLLDLVKSKDIDESGKQLTKVLEAAQTINTKNLIERPKLHSLPIIGSLFAKLDKSRETFFTNLGSVKTQIEGLFAEIEKNQSGLKKRVNMLDKMFIEVGQEHKELGIHIASGMLVMDALKDQIEKMKSVVGGDPIEIQRISDLNSSLNSLEKRVSDLRVLQQSCRQTLPMIRIIQSNNLMLVEKFDAIKNITLPAWKNQISLTISLQEQKNSVQLANTIDDATNELLKRNADLLHQNSVDTARANQRAVIDVETLEYVQDKLIATVKDTLAVQKEGMAKREEASNKIKALQGNLSQLVLDNTSKAS